MEFKKREITSLKLSEDKEDYLNMRKKSIMNMIDWKWHLVNQKKEETEVFLDWKLFMYELSWKDFVIFYENIKERENDMKLLNDNFKAKWIYSVKMEDWNQVPEIIWPFEYYWKIWLWIHARNDLDNSKKEIDEKWVYKWVVVKPELFFKTKKTVEENKWKVEKIVIN